MTPNYNPRNTYRNYHTAPQYQDHTFRPQRQPSHQVSEDDFDHYDDLGPYRPGTRRRTRPSDHYGDGGIHHVPPRDDEALNEPPRGDMPDVLPGGEERYTDLGSGEALDVPPDMLPGDVNPTVRPSFGNRPLPRIPPRLGKGRKPCASEGDVEPYNEFGAGYDGPGA